MENLKLVLDHTGAGFDRVVIARIFLTDFRDYDEANHYFGQSFEVKRAVGDRRQMGAALQNLGTVAIDSRDDTSVNAKSMTSGAKQLLEAILNR